MSLLVGIIAGLLGLSVIIFAWALVMKRIHARKALGQSLPNGQALSSDPMEHAVKPVNPHARRARGADAAARNFAPTLTHR